MRRGNQKGELQTSNLSKIFLHIFPFSRRSYQRKTYKHCFWQGTIVWGNFPGSTNNFWWREPMKKPLPCPNLPPAVFFFDLHFPILHFTLPFEQMLPSFSCVICWMKSDITLVSNQFLPWKYFCITTSNVTIYSWISNEYHMHNNAIFWIVE